MLADPTTRGLVRTIAKSLKQSDPATLEPPLQRLKVASDHGTDLARRLSECEKHLRGMEIHLRSVAELIESGTPVPGTDRARFAGIVRVQRSRFEALCSGDLIGAAGPGMSALRERRQGVRLLFDRLARRLSY